MENMRLCKLTVNSSYANSLGGYAAILRPEGKPLERLERVSADIRDITGAIRYSLADFHVTIAGMNPTNGFELEDSDPDALQKFYEAVKGRFQNFNPKKALIFGRLRIDDFCSSVLLQGNPGGSLADRKSSLGTASPDLIVISRGHITTNRFTKETGDQAVISSLDDLIDGFNASNPFLSSNVVFPRLDIVSYRISDDGFEHEVHHSISF